jgi:outer membrane protein TolC
MQLICLRRIRGSCFAASLCLVAVPMLAAERALTLDEAQRLAVERSRQLEAQSLAIGASREMAVAAGQLPDPVLSVGVENLPVEGTDRFSLTRDFMTMRRIGISQELTRKEKRALRAERYELEAVKGLAEQELARAAVRRDAATAWLDTWHGEAQAALIADQRVRGLQEVQGAEAEYRAGRGSQGDVLMARAGLAMLDDRAAEVERRIRNARAMLVRWTGVDATTKLAPKPVLSAADLHEHSLEELLASHPQVSIFTRQEAVASAEARLASASKKPDWTVGVAYSVRGSAFGDMVSIGVSVPLPWDQANRQDREVAAKLAGVSQAQALREEALRQHVAETRAMLDEWRINQGRIARYEREIVPLAAARAEAAVAAYRGGKATINDVLSARRLELDARFQALQIEAENARTWAQLVYFVPGISK